MNIMKQGWVVMVAFAGILAVQAANACSIDNTAVENDLGFRALQALCRPLSELTRVEVTDRKFEGGDRFGCPTNFIWSYAFVFKDGCGAEVRVDRVRGVTVIKQSPDRERCGFCAAG